MTAKRTPPGPSRQGGGSEISWADPLSGFLALALEYGPVVRVHEKGFSWYLVSHPEEIKYVLQDNGRHYRKNLVYNRMLSPLLGDSLLTSEGETWHRQRRIAQPTFHRQHIAAQVDKITAATRAMLSRWEGYWRAHEEINLDAEMMRLTIEIVGQILMNLDLTEQATEIGEVISAAADGYAKQGHTVPPIQSDENVFGASNSPVAKLLDDILARRRSALSGREDLLSLLLSLEEQAMLTEREVREAVVTLLFTGSETCSRVLSWTWYLLAGAPEVELRLREEVCEILGQRAPRYEDLPRLTLTSQIIAETMRLFPPVWSFGRRPIHDDCVGGYDIPAGALVLLSPYVTHRLPLLWEDPEGFDPSRFAPEAAAGRARFAYFPFGGGQRECIGYHLALLEAQVILAMIARDFRLRLSPNHPVIPEPTSTLRRRGGIRATLSRPDPPELRRSAVIGS